MAKFGVRQKYVTGTDPPSPYAGLPTAAAQAGIGAWSSWEMRAMEKAAEQEAIANWMAQRGLTAADYPFAVPPAPELYQPATGFVAPSPYQIDPSLFAPIDYGAAATPAAFTDPLSLSTLALDMPATTLPATALPATTLPAAAPALGTGIGTGAGAATGAATGAGLGAGLGAGFGAGIGATTPAALLAPGGVALTTPAALLAPAAAPTALAAQTTAALSPGALTLGATAPAAVAMPWAYPLVALGSVLLGGLLGQLFEPDAPDVKYEERILPAEKSQPIPLTPGLSPSGGGVPKYKELLSKYDVGLPSGFNV